MMMKRLVSFCLICVLALSACQADTGQPETNETDKEVADVSLTEANNELGFSMISLAFEEEENVFLSPTSALLAMLIAYNGSAGDTKTEMEQAFKLNSFTTDEINEASNNLIAHLNEQNFLEIAIANSLWINDDYSFQDTFAKQVTDYFHATIEEIDIYDDESANRINHWVKEQTNDKITEIVEPPLPKDLLAYIINAVYFNGTWKYEFDKSLTTDMTFYGASEDKEIPFMSLTEELPYFETDQFQAVKLPYGESSFNMQIILPKPNESLAQLTESLHENWNDWQTQFTQKEGTVLMPKFTLEYELVLNDILQEMGIKAAFNPGHADFTKMAETEKQIYISEVKQKTFIDVHEEGTEAAAVTNVEMVLTSAPIDEEAPFYMEINQPFLLVIQDDESKQILFIGAIQQLDK